MAIVRRWPSSRSVYLLDGRDLLPEPRRDGCDLLPELQLGGARILLGRDTPRNGVAQALGNRLGLGFLQPTFFSRRAAAVKVSDAKLADIPARNLTRELRIQIDRYARGTTPKRAALRCFREMETLRRTPVRRTGRIIRPGGKSILSMNGNDSLEGELRHAPTALNAAA